MMNNDFDSGIIDTTSVLSIVNKLNLYIENEEKIIGNIQSSLSLLSDYYSSDNCKILNDKINNLYSALSVMLENKKKYVEFIVNIVNGYVTQNDTNTAIFNNYDIS